MPNLYLRERDCLVGCGRVVSHSVLCGFAALDLHCVVFFSSRRRHTRYWRDWSSDVCSSDLGDGHALGPVGQRLVDVADVGLMLVLGVAAQPGDVLALLGVVEVGEARVVELQIGRSGERRVGKEGRFRWAPDQLKIKKAKHYS